MTSPSNIETIMEEAIEELTIQNVVLDSMRTESWPGIEIERQQVSDKIEQLKAKIRLLRQNRWRSSNDGVFTCYLAHLRMSLQRVARLPGAERYIVSNCLQLCQILRGCTHTNHPCLVHQRVSVTNASSPNANTPPVKSFTAPATLLPHSSELG